MGDHEPSVIKHGEHLFLDQPLLRLPNELLRKNFRTAHFVIEKDTTALRTLLKDSANAAVSGRASQQDIVKNVDAMIARMRGVKRKLASCADEEARLHAQTAARIAHLHELHSMNSVDDVRYEAWNRQRLDRVLADYMLRCGYNQSAKQLAEQSGLTDLVDVDTFAAMSKIREALMQGSVTEALAWCTDNKKELRKMESKLEFMLRFQQYIELVRTEDESKLIEAIAHAKKHLIPYRATYPKEVSQACGLLAFPPGLTGSIMASYVDLYKPRRWIELAELFTETHNSLLALPSVPLLHIALSVGLSALKTPSCHSSTSHNQRLPLAPPPTSSNPRHGVCPICSTELNELARSVPYAHHNKSHVEPDLMLLPNGRVYGKARLKEQAAKAGIGPAFIKDPCTGEAFSIESLKKVYIT